MSAISTERGRIAARRRAGRGDPPGPASRAALARRLGAILAMALFAAACAFGAYYRREAVADSLQGTGLLPWPGNSEGDASYLWRSMPRSLQLVAFDPPGASVFVFPLGFAAWMAAMGWLLRQTPAPYIFAAAGCAVALLVTGGPGLPGTHDPVPTGLRVDGVHNTYSQPGEPDAPLCGTVFAVERRSGARGASWWVMARSPDSPPADVYVFHGEANARLLTSQIAGVQVQACRTGR